MEVKGELITMGVFIVYESMFGNTRQVAEAIASGLQTEGVGTVTVVDVTQAPSTVPDDLALLLVGGPTHAFSMTRQSTRADAATKGASGPTTTGIREWIEGVVPQPAVPVVTFDTRVHVKLMPGSAAKSAASHLRHAGFRTAERGETFWVSDTAGPLTDGELDRARAWGAELAQRFALRTV